jgi:regulator of sigma E protease
VSYLRDGERNSVTLQPIESTEWFLAARGLVFGDFVEPLQITNWGTACQLALQQTSKDLFMVLGFLKKLVTGEISPNNLGGPVTIVAVATSEASMGTGRLLLFLTMLSANLAVINFLPIPVLDGGHLVFLVAEGLRGKPVDEQLQFRLTVAGLIFILGLMVYVLGLDFLRFLPFFY